MLTHSNPEVTVTHFAINFNILLNHHHLNHPSPNYNTITTAEGVELVEEQCPECHLIISRMPPQEGLPD